MSKDLPSVDQAIHGVGSHFDYQGEVEVFVIDMDDEDIVTKNETDKKADGKEDEGDGMGAGKQITLPIHTKQDSSKE
jgi:hypothetical protein